MNIKVISIMVLTILVVGLSTISAVAATDSGVIQSVQIPKDKIIPSVICKGIEVVKVIEKGKVHVIKPNAKIRPIPTRSGPLIPAIPLNPSKIFPKPIIITPSRA